MSDQVPCLKFWPTGTQIASLSVGDYFRGVLGGHRAVDGCRVDLLDHDK